MKSFVRAICPILIAAGSACAQTEVYFCEYQFNGPSIGAMALDGSNQRVLFTPPSNMWLPYGMTFSASTHRLIWMDSAGGSDIVSANLDILVVGAGSSTCAPTKFPK